MSSLRQDLVHALRVFRRTPWFFSGLLLTLALGIGANGAVFSILRAVLLAPLPYREPDGLVMVWRAREHVPTSVPDILRPALSRMTPNGDQAVAVHDRTEGVFSDTATYLSWQGNLEPQLDLTVGDHTERLRGMFTTPNFFDLLGVSAAQGRLYTEADAGAGVPVLVLSDSAWRRDFGADRSIVGRPVSLLSGRPRQMTTFTVLGVLPPTFRFTYPVETEAWALWSWSNVRSAGSRIGYWTVARLAPNTSLQVAQARVSGIPTIERRPVRPADREAFRLEPISEWVVGETRPSMLLLGGVALLLLCITCATVASALFVRLAERQQELAIRGALGAERRRLVRQLLTEGALLSLTGAALGTALATVLAPALRAFMPPTIPRGDQIGIDLWTLAFFAATAGAVTMLSALAPASRGTRVDVVSSLKRSATVVSADRATARWRQGLVGLGTAMASALLVTATLLLISFWRLNRVPLGFDGERVLTVEMRLISPKYLPVPAPKIPGQPRAPDKPAPALIAFQDQLLTGVRGLPGVLDAGLTSAVPFRGTDFYFVLNRKGDTKTVAGNGRFVDAGYFSVLKVPLLKGRLFSDADSPTSPAVAVISASYARQMFGDDDPLGQIIEGDHDLQVVGVVGDMHYQSAQAEPIPAIYLPRSQVPNELICVVARTAPNAGNVGMAVRRLVHALDPDVPAMNLTTVDQIVSDSVADRRFYTTATTAFASLALLLTIAGLVVVISRAVVERQRELAIRTALGASRRAISSLILTGGLSPVVVGTAVGLAAAFAAATLVKPFLFQIEPRTVWAYGSVAILVCGIALTASFVPLRRAIGQSPASLLRAE